MKRISVRRTKDCISQVYGVSVFPHSLGYKVMNGHYQILT